MSYTANTPQTGQSLGFTRPIINSNFQTINTAFAINHIAFNISGAGKHKFVEMPNQSVIPSPLAGGEGTLYCKASGGAAQVFYTPGVSTNEYQLTRAITASFATFGTNTGYAANHTGGWTFLPGGMLLQYGLRISAGTSGVITFPTAFTNAPYSITVSLYSNAASRTVVVDTGTAPTTTGFNFINSAAGLGVFWTAIGV